MPRGPDKKPRKKRIDGIKPPPNRPGRNRSTGLPKGAVGAIKALRHRVPEGASEEVASLADEAFETVVAVMRGDVATKRVMDAVVDDKGNIISRSTVVHSPTLALQAARIVREEVCGPPTVTVEVKGQLQLSEDIRNARLRARQEPEVDHDDDA